MEQNQVLMQLYNSLMKIPHQRKEEYDNLVQAFRQGIADYPAFMSHASVYVALNSIVRDQADAAIMALLQSSPEYMEYRVAGQALLLGNRIYSTQPNVPGLPPFRIFRVAKHIRESDNKIARRMRSIMSDYMTAVQEDQNWFDNVVMLNRAEVAFAYPYYHIPMNALSKAVLYDNDPPEGTRLHALKVVSKTEDAVERARLIIQHQIPYRIASGLSGGLTNETKIAMIDVMTPTEALNSRSWVEESGLLQIPEVKKAFMDKLSQAQASIASAQFRKSSQGSDEELQRAIDQAQEKSAAKATRISGQTDIWLDVSGSMEKAIEITPEFASRIWALSDDVAIIAHNSSAWKINVPDTGNPLQDVRKALHGTRAMGGTQFDVCLQKSRELGRTPQRIVMLTDGGENGFGTQGRFAPALQRYVDETGVVPQLTMIEVKGYRTNDDCLSGRIRQAGFEIEKFKYEGDYYLFDQVVTFLQGETPKSLVEKIMEVELPVILGKVK